MTPSVTVTRLRKNNCAPDLVEQVVQWTISVIQVHHVLVRPRVLSYCCQLEARVEQVEMLRLGNFAKYRRVLVVDSVLEDDHSHAPYVADSGVCVDHTSCEGFRRLVAFRSVTFREIWIC